MCESLCMCVCLCHGVCACVCVCECVRVWMSNCMYVSVYETVYLLYVCYYIREPYIDIAMCKVFKNLQIQVMFHLMILVFLTFFFLVFFTPPRNRGGVIFLLQLVCVSVCVCVCVQLFSCEQNSSRTIAPIWMQFSLKYCTGSDPIEIDDLGLKVKVTVTENVSKNDEKKIR